MLRPLNPIARALAPHLQRIADRYGFDTEGMELSVSTRTLSPHTIGATIYLPVMRASLYPRVFVHEWQHARDGLDGVRGSGVEMELRAQRTERLFLQHSR